MSPSVGRRAGRLSTAVVHLICNQGVTGSNPVAGTRLSLLIPSSRQGFIPIASAPSADGALFFGALEIEASRVRRLMTGERHHVLLAQFGIAKLGHGGRRRASDRPEAWPHVQ